MVVPKIGTQLILKRVADEVLLKPAAAAAAPENAEVVAEAPPAQQLIPHDMHGKLIYGEEGEAVGIARRVAGAAVYVIAPASADPVAEVRACLEEDESQVLYLWTDDALTGIVYVPDPNRVPPPPDGLRADDI